MTKFSSLAFWLIIPWSASKTIRIVSFRNNVRSNLLLFSPWKFSRAFSRISQIVIRGQIQYELLETEPQSEVLRWTKLLKTQEKKSISVRSLVVDTIEIGLTIHTWHGLRYPILASCCKEIPSCKGNIREHEMIHPYRQSRILRQFHLDIFWHEILHICQRLMRQWETNVLVMGPFSIFLTEKNTPA